MYLVLDFKFQYVAWLVPMVTFYAHKGFQECSMTLLQYYTYHEHTHNMMSLLMNNTLCVSFMLGMCHAISW